MRDSFDYGFVDISDIMPGGKNNQIEKLSEEQKQQYLREKIKKIVTDVEQKESYLDKIDFSEYYLFGDDETFLYRLSCQMYSVIGLYNLEKYNNNPLSFNKKLIKLRELGKEMDEIMDIRRSIYNELKTACSTIEFRNTDNKSYGFISNSKTLIDEDFKNIIIELSKKLLLNENSINGKSVDTNYLINTIRYLNQSMEKYTNIDSKLNLSGVAHSSLQDFATKLIYIIAKLNKNINDNKKFTNYKTKFFETVKNYREFIYGDKLWGLHLLSVLISNDTLEASDKSVDEEKYKFNDIIENMEVILEHNDQYEKQVFELYYYHERHLLVQQMLDNIVSVSLYSFEQIPSVEFYNEKHVKEIVNVLMGSKYLKNKYIDTSIFCSDSHHKGSGCFAIMMADNSEKSYVSLSGVGLGNKEKIKEFITKVTALSYIYAGNEGDYYLEDGSKLSLERLKGSISSTGKGKIDKSYNRMFSCCERKFVGFLKNGHTYRIYVKYSPCYMCERMVDYEQNNKRCTIEIICPESKRCGCVEYDAIAKEILKR